MLRIVKYNAGLIATRLAAAAIGVFPDRSFAVGLLSLPYGALKMLRGVSKWKYLARFAVLIDARMPALLFAPWFFIREAENVLWAKAMHETAGTAARHVEFEGTGPLKAVLDEGRGAVIVGAHYGPLAVLRLLQHEGVYARALANDKTIDDCMAASRCCLPGLRTRELGFLTEPGRLIQTRRSEKDLARHVIDGGAVFIMGDHPAYYKGGEVTDFLGFPIRLNTFAFKLALRHDVPVFFLFIRRKRFNSFLLSLKRCDAFDTPLEGLKMYVSDLESVISSDPSAWTYLRKYGRLLDRMRRKA